MFGEINFFNSGNIRKIYVFFIMCLIASIFVGFNYRVPLVYGALTGLYFLATRLDDNILKIFSKDLVWFYSLLAWSVYYIFHGLLYGDHISMIGRETVPFVVLLLYVSFFCFSKIKADFFVAFISVSIIVGGLRTFYNAYYLDVSRPSFTYQPIIDAHIHLLGSMICLFCYKKKSFGFLKILLFMAFVLGLTSAILSETRGIYPALIFLLSFFVYKYYGFKCRGFVYFFLGVFFVIFLAFVGKVGDRVVSQTFYEINEILKGNLNTSIGLRLQMWDVALSAGADSWIFGIGKSDKERKRVTSDIISAENYNSGLMYQHHNFHNDILDHFVKYGVVGVLLFVFVFFAPFFGLNRKWKTYMFIIVVVYLFAGLTVNYFEHRRAFVIYFILVAIVRYLSASEGDCSETIQ